MNSTGETIGCSFIIEFLSLDGGVTSSVTWAKVNRCFFFFKSR